MVQEVAPRGNRYAKVDQIEMKALSGQLHLLGMVTLLHGVMIDVPGSLYEPEFASWRAVASKLSDTYGGSAGTYRHTLARMERVGMVALVDGRKGKIVRLRLADISARSGPDLSHGLADISAMEAVQMADISATESPEKASNCASDLVFSSLPSPPNELVSNEKNVKNHNHGGGGAHAGLVKETREGQERQAKRNKYPTQCIHKDQHPYIPEKLEPGEGYQVGIDYNGNFQYACGLTVTGCQERKERINAEKQAAEDLRRAEIDAKWAAESATAPRAPQVPALMQPMSLSDGPQPKYILTKHGWEPAQPAA